MTWPKGKPIPESRRRAIIAANRRRKGKFKHTAETKRRLSDIQKDRWRDPGCVLNSEEYRRVIGECSRRMWEQGIGPGSKEAARKRAAGIKRARVNPDNEANFEDARAKISRSVKRCWNDPSSVFNSTEYRAKLSAAQAARVSRDSANLPGGIKYVHGTFYSDKLGRTVHYRSSYELEFIKMLEQDDEVVWYGVECNVVKYTIDGIVRCYIPDFFVEYDDGDWLVIEVKPKGLLCDPVNVAKFDAALKVYGKHFEVWTEEDIFSDDEAGLN